jgi:hypothetical protein
MRKILKGAVILLIAVAMFFSTVAVTADTTDITPIANPDQQNNPPEYIKNNQPVTHRGLLWDNGDSDLINALVCQRVGLVDWADSADDFHLEKKTTVQKIVWETVDTYDYVWDGTDDLIIYEYTPNGPGPEIVKILEVQNTRELLGEQWAKNWYRYEIDLTAQGQEFNLPKGDYYILVRPYTSGNTGMSYWMTSTPPPGSTSEGYFKSDYFGYPDWTPCTTVTGDPWDFSFKIYGTQDFSSESNRPILNFLSNHFNLFPVLQLFLQKLGL